MDNIQYLLALHSIDGLGPIRLKAILDNFKDPKLVWEANEAELQTIGIPKNVIQNLVSVRKSLSPEEFINSIEKSGIKWITLFDENYPKLLKEIYDPPIVLYYKGNLGCLKEKTIAVVGTRKMTGYGKIVCEQFVKALVNFNLTIVSGLARGIDSQAHKTAVVQGGQTAAVLGGGLNEIYPTENIGLAQNIIDGYGVLISEYPPDYPSFPGNFPARNRIISGLSLAILVVEAAQDSGSLITARAALEQGRDVFAIPGPITSHLSRGPINLIKDGARAVFEPGEILDEMGLFQTKGSSTKVKNEEELSKEEKKVLEALEYGNLHIDEIGRILQFESAKISSLLLKMEITGLVQNLGSGMYCRI